MYFQKIEKKYITVPFFRSVIVHHASGISTYCCWHCEFQVHSFFCAFKFHFFLIFWFLFFSRFPKCVVCAAFWVCRLWRGPAGLLLLFYSSEFVAFSFLLLYGGLFSKFDCWVIFTLLITERMAWFTSLSLCDE